MTSSKGQENDISMPLLHNYQHLITAGCLLRGCSKQAGHPKRHGCMDV